MATRQPSAVDSEREVRKCAKCKLDKWLDDFYINPKTGWVGYCLDCHSQSSRLSARRQQVVNRDEYNKYQREYQKDYRRGIRRGGPHRARKTLSDL